MIKILLIFGTRPEAIKMAPLIKEFEKYPEFFKSVICVTGQHREMLDQVLNIFDIKPDFNLKIMKQGQDLYDITTCILTGIRDVINSQKPDLILVHGDTTTCMVSSISSFYQQIPIGHIEAGLRTNNIYNPWPEELNRQITSRIAKYHFAPTELSKKNLINENISENSIFITGNTVIDALFTIVNKIKNNTDLSKKINQNIKKFGYDPNRLVNDKKIVLITGHRRENFGDGLHNICKAIRDLAKKYSSVDFIYPMHLNPNVRLSIKNVFGDDLSIYNNIFLIEPLDYLSFIQLMANSYIVLTDSGGIQEEAPSLGKPVLVMRDTTERPEALKAGTIKLVGTNYKKIYHHVSKLLNNSLEYEKMAKSNNPYGDGNASKRIVTKLMEIFDCNRT